MTGALDKIAGGQASKLIAKYGKSITLTRITEGDYDPSTATTSNTSVASTINAVVEEYKGYDLANNLAVVGDKKLTVAAKGLVAPSLADQITIDGVTFSIVNIQTINSGELAALYVIQGRKR